MPPTLDQPASSTDEKRMSIGEHLEELRTCLLRSLIALVAACLLCIWPSRYLLELIARPVILVLRRHGLPESFLATSPVETVVIYIKVVLIAGVVLAAPYILYQLWTFVAAGLYLRERAWVYKLLPLSVGLFAAGVLFMYVFVLLVSLNFLVGFGAWLPLPKAEPNALERVLLHLPDQPQTTTRPAEPLQIAVIPTDPPEPPAGGIWFNAAERRLKLRVGQETLSVTLSSDQQRGLVAPHFRIGEYLSFFLIMTIAFGTAFQMPLVVVFLTSSGIVSVTMFRSYRKVVILLIVFIAGLLAPPDLLSHLMLSGPMILLFELGLWLSARRERAAAARADTDNADGDLDGAAPQA